MILDDYILGYKANPVHDKILEFYSFLLRNIRDIDQTDFSNNYLVLKKLKRYEEIKIWQELDELTKKIESK